MTGSVVRKPVSRVPLVSSEALGRSDEDNAALSRERTVKQNSDYSAGENALDAPTQTLTVARAERDGCDCPPWFVRCAHVDNEVLWLSDSMVARELHGIQQNCQNTSVATVTYLYLILRSSDTEPCVETDIPFSHPTYDYVHNRLQAADDRAAADRAFDQAVAVLLERAT